MRFLMTAGVLGALALVAGCAGATSGHPKSSAASNGSTGSATSGTTSSSTSGSASSDAPSGAAFTDPQEVRQVLADATNAIRVVNSYDYRDLAKFRAAAEQVSTGTYLAQFDKAYQLVARSAPKLHATQQASVTRIGLGPVDGPRETVVAVGRLVSSSTAGRRTTPFAVVAHMQLSGARWRLAQLVLDGQLSGTPPGTPALIDAVGSARDGVEALLSVRRATLAADQRNALARTTGELRTELQRTASKTRAAVTKGGYDLLGVVRAVAVERASGPSVTVLVTATAYRIVDAKRSAPTKQSVEVTVVQSGSGWLLSNLVNVGAS